MSTTRDRQTYQASHAFSLTTATRLVVLGFFFTVSILSISSILTQPAKSPQVLAVEEETTIKNLRFYRVFWWSVSAAAASVALLCGLLLAVSYSRSLLKKASVFLFKIGQSEIRVHERDLSLAWPAVLGLTSAQQLERHNAGLEKALELYAVMGEIQTRQLRALAGHRAPGLTSALPLAGAEQEGFIHTGGAVPSFASLLSQGLIAPGKPLILGFHKATGLPETGALQDLYSTIVIGLSGFGKTTCLAYLIGASVLAEQACVDVLDRHYPSPESLGRALGALVQTPSLTLISNPFALDEQIGHIEQTLNARLSTGTNGFCPRIVVVDEHEIWARYCKRLVEVELRIINEGRKVRMDLFLTSKSAKADKIGDSALRDSMCTSYLFKTKRHNARIFFKDREKEALLKELRAPGEAIFTNRRDESLVVRLPYARPEDMQTVAAMLPAEERTDGPPRHRDTERRKKDLPQRRKDAKGITVSVTPELLKQERQRLGLSLQDIVDRTAIKNKMQLSRFEHGKAELSEREQQQVLHLLFAAKDAKSAKEDRRCLRTKNPSRPFASFAAQSCGDTIRDSPVQGCYKAVTTPVTVSEIKD